MKKISMFAFALMATATLFAAPKKTTDDWVAEIESSVGSIDWKFKDNLSKAKTLITDTLYNIDVTKSDVTLTITNPMPMQENVMQIGYLQETDIGTTKGNKKLADLNKGDVFLTYEGEYSNQAHLWVLKNKKVLSEIVKVTSEGGLSITDSTHTAMKYRGWSTGDFNSDAAKGVYQGATFWGNDVGYYTNSTPSKGEFSIMIINVGTRTLSEYQLLYLGSSNNVKFIKSLYDSKYKGIGKRITVKEGNNNNRYVYWIDNPGYGLKPYKDTSIFCQDTVNGGVRNLFDVQCGEKIEQLINEGKFYFLLLSNDGKPYICLTEVPF